MAYYKVLIEIWCDWDPEDSGLEEMVRHVLLGENSICTLQEVIKVVDRPQHIDNEEAMSFFGGQEGDADQSQGRSTGIAVTGGLLAAGGPDKRMSLRKACLFFLSGCRRRHS